MKLFPHQEVARDFLLEKKRAILADSPRVGKTIPAAAAAAMHQPVLVVCPAVVKPGWVKAFTALGHSAAEIVGRKAAQQAKPDGITVINYDLLSDLPTHDGWNTLVLDEAHRIKTPTAKRTKAALKLMKHTPRVYGLSGTPIPNKPAELWPLLHGLGIYKRSWMQFVARYAGAWIPPWGGLDVSGATNIPELREKLKPHVLRRKREDVFKTYQQPVFSLVELDLPVDRREKEFSADAIAEALDTHPNAVMAFEGLSQIMKEGGIQKAPYAADFIRSRIEQEPSEPLVVFAWHKDVVALISEALNAAPAIQHVVVTGATSPTDKQRAIDDFQAGRVQVIIGNISSISEGVDLSRSSTVIFAESTWQTSALEQASARVENINKTACAALIYILTIRASLDSIVLSKVLKKSKIIEQII